MKHFMLYLPRSALIKSESCLNQIRNASEHAKLQNSRSHSQVRTLQVFDTGQKSPCWKKNGAIFLESTSEQRLSTGQESISCPGSVLGLVLSTDFDNTMCMPIRSRNLSWPFAVAAGKPVSVGPPLSTRHTYLLILCCRWRHARPADTSQGGSCRAL